MIGGAAGDMLMGAWVDAGLDVAQLERALRTVVADGWELVMERVDRAGVSALHLDLVIPGEDDHRHGSHEHGAHHHDAPRGYRLRDVLEIVARSGLSARQIERASTIYRRLADASARSRGEDADTALFHAVGQLDAMLDVAGTCIALDLLGIEAVWCSPFPRGGDPDGSSLELLRGWPIRTIDLHRNLVTATGAAILTTIATPGAAPAMIVEHTGAGAGRRNFAVPNVVRVEIGEAAGSFSERFDSENAGREGILRSERSVLEG